MFKKRVLLIAAAIAALVAVPAIATAAGGFDEFGYNYQARLFVGPADGSDRVIDGKVWGDATYANDHLVMKWSKAWDDARFHGAPWTSEAWLNNEWNGNVPGGSGESEIFKAVWVGNCVADPALLPEGSYCIWGEFAVLMDHYPSEEWIAHANPTGYGAYSK